MQDLVGVEPAVDAVGNDGLAGLEVQLYGRRVDVDLVGSEDTRLSPVQPRGQALVYDQAAHLRSPMV